jgi:hypothetical protein
MPEDRRKARRRGLIWPEDAENYLRDGNYRDGEKRKIIVKNGKLLCRPGFVGNLRAKE